MKPMLVFAAVFALAGCMQPADQWTMAAYESLTKIKGLEDCTHHRVYTGDRYISIIRCPNSAVSTTTLEKHPKTAIVIDGVEYERKASQ